MRFVKWLTGLAVVLACAGMTARPAAAQYSGGSFYASDGDVSISFFYDELDDYGDWVDYGDYGYCWVPEDVDYGWRPYSLGYWSYTDFGWTWVSNEPFGWATYHYGRWVFDPYYGWIWVPGTVWAPAWVAWRESPDYIGWCPLPPEVGWSFSVGLQFGNYGFSRLPYDRWCFVERDRFVTTNVSRVIVPVTRNRVLIDRTVNATRFKSRHGYPVNEGVSVSRIERAARRQVPRFRVADVRSPERLRGNRVQGDRLGMFRPHVRGSARDVVPRNLRNDVERIRRGRPDRTDVGRMSEVRERALRDRAVRERTMERGRSREVIERSRDEQRERGRREAYQRTLEQRERGRREAIERARDEQRERGLEQRERGRRESYQRAPERERGRRDSYQRVEQRERGRREAAERARQERGRERSKDDEERDDNGGRGRGRR